MDEPLITVSGQNGTNNSFDITSVGFDTKKKYTVAEFNQTLKKADEKWLKEIWDGISYPNDIVIVTIENLHNDPCTYRFNFSDTEYHSIQEIVALSPTPMYASLTTEKAIEKLNTAEAIDRHAAEYGADGKRVFPNTQNNTVENIPQQRDISHNTTNAALSATGGKDKIMATKMECTGMLMFAEGNAKATAQVTINDEFTITRIRVYEGKNGLRVAMPPHKIGGEYKDAVFPVTAEARAQLNNAVLETYGKLAEKGLDKLPIEKKEPPEKSVSKIDVKLSLFQSDNEAQKSIKAVGQIKIDDCIVISDVTVKHGINQAGVEKDFVSMPYYKSQLETGKYVYTEYAFPTTKECYERINKAVLGAYETLKNTQYKGVNKSELGERSTVSTQDNMHNSFAEKLMAELDKKGIVYSAAVAKTTSLTVKKADIAAVNKIQTSLQNTLENALAASSAAQNQQQTQTKTKPKSRK